MTVEQCDSIMKEFQSTRPIRGATHQYEQGSPGQDISIHAPHTGRDSSIRAGESGPGYFNPRAPYGARRDSSTNVANIAEFQSTRPIRGATTALWSMAVTVGKISIHAPHTGRDPTTTRDTPRTSGFQSTRPIRGATSSIRAGDSGPGYFNPRAPYGARRARNNRQRR